jgi:hypothetical protein
MFVMEVGISAYWILGIPLTRFVLEEKTKSFRMPGQSPAEPTNPN